MVRPEIEQVVPLVQQKETESLEKALALLQNLGRALRFTRE
jgi:hypothetical protein